MSQSAISFQPLDAPSKLDFPFFIFDLSFFIAYLP